MTILRRSPHSIRRQRGLLTILITVAFLLILGFAALAIDINHMVLHKAKLQNIVDSAALAAAEQAYLTPGTNSEKTTAAQNAITELFTEYQNKPGNDSLSLPMTFANTEDSVNLENALILLFARNDLNDTKELEFNSYNVVNPNTIYVKVQIINYPLDSYFIGLFDIDKVVSASAVAGLVSVYGPTVPITVCAIDPDDTTYDLSTDPPDTTIYGFEQAKAYALKLQAAGELMQAGNYQLLDTGKQGMAEAMASSCDVCQVENGDFLLSEPGNSVGPVGEGLNVRFNEYNGSMKKYEFEKGFEADDYVVEIGTDYDIEYLEEFETPEEYANAVTLTEKENKDPNGNGISGETLSHPDFFATHYAANSSNFRRMVFVPVIDCLLDEGEEAPKSGKGTYEKLNDLCFLLLQKAPTSSGDKTPIIGEFRYQCPTFMGTIAEDDDLTGPVRAVLLKDPDSEDS